MNKNYEYLNDEYDTPRTGKMSSPTKGAKQVNNRMATLKRTEGVLNRYRKQGVIR